MVTTKGAKIIAAHAGQTRTAALINREMRTANIESNMDLEILFICLIKKSAV